MKKASGFEKFYKGGPKKGGAKKEEIRQEKREVRKEREQRIADAKRKQRAAAKDGRPQPPKYNLEPPGSRFEKRKPGHSPFKPTSPQKAKPSIEKRGGDDVGQRPGAFGKQGGPRPFQKGGKPAQQKERFEKPDRRTDERPSFAPRKPEPRFGVEKSVGPRNEFASKGQPHRPENFSSAKPNANSHRPQSNPNHKPFLAKAKEGKPQPSVASTLR